MQSPNLSLIIAGILSCTASLMHLAIIIGGPQWYRFFGAGEQMATMAAQGQWYPTLVTSFIALVLFGWALYAFSGAGLIAKLPLLKNRACGNYRHLFSAWRSGSGHSFLLHLY